MLSEEARSIIAAGMVAKLATERPWIEEGDDVELDIPTAMQFARDAITETLDTKLALAIALDDDHSMQIQDLPVGTLDNIARKHGVSWQVVVGAPFSVNSLGIAQDLVTAVAATLKTTAPKRLTARSIVLLFDMVPDSLGDEDDKPAEVERGPLPEPAGDES